METPITTVDVRGLKRKIAGMSGAQMREAMQDPAFVQQCEAAGIPVLRGTWAQIQSRGAIK